MKMMFLFLMVVFAAMVDILHAIALSAMWKWFIVPTFNLPLISPLVSFAIILMISLFSNNIPDFEKKTPTEQFQYVFNRLTQISLIFGIGAILSFFM